MSMKMGIFRNILLGNEDVVSCKSLAHLSRRLTDELIVYLCSVVRRCRRRRCRHCRRRCCPHFSNISSENAWPSKAKLHVEHP